MHGSFVVTGCLWYSSCQIRLRSGLLWSQVALGKDCLRFEWDQVLGYLSLDHLGFGHDRLKLSVRFFKIIRLGLGTGRTCFFRGRKVFIGSAQGITRKIK